MFRYFWLPATLSRPARTGKKRSRATPASPRPRRLPRPTLEQLEDRNLLDAVQWNAGVSGFWDVAANWLDTTTSQNRVPNSADDVTINQPGVTVTVRFGQSANTLQSNDDLAI